MCEHEHEICPKHGGGFDCTPFCDICEGEQEYCPTCDPYAKEQAEIYLKMNDWQPEDIITTNFRTIVQASQENHDRGWDSAIAMVLDVCGEMYNEFDQSTLDELKQRIV